MAGTLGQPAEKVNRNQRRSHDALLAPVVELRTAGGECNEPPPARIGIGSGTFRPRLLTGIGARITVCPVLNSVQSCFSTREEHDRFPVVRSPPIAPGGEQMAKSRVRRALPGEPGPAVRRAMPVSASAGADSSRGRPARGRRSRCPACSLPAAVTTTPRAAAAPAAARPTGTVTFGSNESGGVPKKRFADVFTAVRSHRKVKTQGQHRRPQHVPGEHQQLPAGQPGRHVLLVRRLPHAVLRRAGPRG